MSKAKGKMKWWHWVLIVLAAIVTFGMISGVTYAAKDELKLNAGAYQVAGVDDQGRVYESEATLVSKMYETKKAELDFEDKASVKVIVHYYDENEGYLSSSTEYTADAVVTAPTNAEYMRFQVIHETDTQISTSEKFEYVSQVDISYFKAEK